MVRALNFKEVGSPQYTMLRLMQAPGEWVKVYSDRIKLAKQTKGLILFPEQFLCMSGPFYVISGPHKSTSVGLNAAVSITRFDTATISLGNTTATTYEQVLEMEELYQSPCSQSGDNSYRTLCVGSMPFHKYLFFTSKKHALKYAIEELQSQAARL